MMTPLTCTSATRKSLPAVRRKAGLLKHFSEKVLFYEPKNGHGLKHNPFNSIIAPRPIGWIGTVSVGNQRNLAPYSFFNAFNYRPPIIGFSSIGYKDTVRNIEDTGHFTWNLATKELASQVNQTSDPISGDEFAHAGLTAGSCRLISSPRVLESPVCFECKATQILQLCAQDKTAIQTWLVCGEVIAVHIDSRLIKDGLYDTVAAAPIMRGGGPADYFGISRADKFQMERSQGHKEDPPGPN